MVRSGDPLQLITYVPVLLYIYAPGLLCFYKDIKTTYKPKHGPDADRKMLDGLSVLFSINAMIQREMEELLAAAKQFT